MDIHTLANPETHSWIGLVLDPADSPGDAACVREILGEHAPLIAVRESDLPQRVLRQLMISGAENILAYSRSGSTAQLAPVLTSASAMAMFRRVVLLHTVDCDSSLLRSSRVVLLRDCPQVRRLLAELVHPLHSDHQVPLTTHQQEVAHVSRIA